METKDSEEISPVMDMDICEQNQLEWQATKSAFQNRIRTGVIKNISHIEPKQFLEDCYVILETEVQRIYKRQAALKMNAVFCCEFLVNKDDEELYELNYINTKSSPINEFGDFLSCYIDEIQDPVLDSLEEFQIQNSGWTLSAIVSLTVTFSYFKMHLGCSYIELPRDIRSKQACVNVRNNDNACFAWAVMSALYPGTKRAQRVSNYPFYANVLNLDGIQFPMQVRQIPRFEKQNNLSINVYTLKLNPNKESRNPLLAQLSYVTKEVKTVHINLLLIQNRYTEEEDVNYKDNKLKYHYVWIKNLSRLLSSQLGDYTKAIYFCDRCLRFFFTKPRRAKHVEVCSVENESSKILLPSKNGDNILNFKKDLHKNKSPYVIYAHLQCFSEKNQQQIPYSIGYYVKCSYDPELSFYKFYRGEDCQKWFTNELTEFAENTEPTYVCDIIRNKLSKEERKTFEKSTSCYICERTFTKECRKVPNHCRFTGVYNGPAHEICNMNFRTIHIVPLVFHNFDSNIIHFIMTNMAADFKGHIDVKIIKNERRYISFRRTTEYMINYRIVDSYNFLPDSIENLFSFLSNGFPLMKSELSDLTDKQFTLATRGVVNLNGYIKNEANLNETKLPKVNELKHVSKIDYEFATNVWDEFRLQNLGEYSDWCLKMNILLLSEIFEEFRNSCISAYQIDPIHYCTLPEYVWDVMLNASKVSLELLTDIDMVKFIEAGTRNGLSQCSKRYSKANNVYLKDYDSSEPSKYLMYLDVNNQYNWTMSQYLPYKNFQWVEVIDGFAVETVPDDSSTGYILEVDLEYPARIHDHHKDLPFCPDFENSLKQRRKLISSLHNKENYILHYRNLKQAIKHGLKLTKIQRILKFEQSPWLKSFTERNQHLTISSKNDFDKNIFGQMNLALFEACVEHFRDQFEVKLINKWHGRYEAENIIAQPLNKFVEIISEDLIAAEMHRKKIHVNKPIYLGMCLLDLAKTEIYYFHYECMKGSFGEDCSICFIDGDSLLYEVRNSDFYELIKTDCEKQFGINDLPQNTGWTIPFESGNSLGVVKYKNNNRILTEYAGLRSKMYAVKLQNVNTASQIKNNKESVRTVITRVKFSDYMDCLFGIQTKTGLSLHDSKRSLVDQTYETLPWGHYSLQHCAKTESTILF